MGTYIKRVVEHLERLGQRGKRHKHVLDHLVTLIQPLHRLALRQLQQRHLWWHRPAKQVPEQRVIAERYDVL